MSNEYFPDVLSEVEEEGEEEAVDVKLPPIGQQESSKISTGGKSSNLNCEINEPNIPWFVMNLDEVIGIIDTTAITRGDDFDDVDDTSSDESLDDAGGADHTAEIEITAEYWAIQKLVRYLKGGNGTATLIALSALRHFKLDQERISNTIRDSGAVEVLINLLDGDDEKCKLGSLQVLKDICNNPDISKQVVDSSALGQVIRTLDSPNKNLQSLAAQAIAKMCQFRKARTVMRQKGGIWRLSNLLQFPGATDETDLNTAINAARAIQSACQSTKNKKALKAANALPMFEKLLKLNREDVAIPVIGTLAECANEYEFRNAIRAWIGEIVKRLKSKNIELQLHSARAIYRTAEDSNTRAMVARHGGMEMLAQLLKKTDNAAVIEAVTGAIWKCAQLKENAVKLCALGMMQTLSDIIDPTKPQHTNHESTLANVCGALAEMLAVNDKNRVALLKSGALERIVRGLLSKTSAPLLVTATQCVREAAQNSECLAAIKDEFEGIRLLWSLLKHDNAAVRANAVWAICPCIDKTKVSNAGELVRSLVGGLEVIVNLLHEDNEEVLAGICLAISKIAQDDDNLAVMTDHNVITLLSGLTGTKNSLLRQHLAEAIASCCKWRRNRITFGENGVVAPLVRYLRSTGGDQEKERQRSCCRALYQLSKEAKNCLILHETGAVPPLLRMIGSEDPELQIAAAGCIANVRKLAMANEMAVNVRKDNPV